MERHAHVSVLIDKVDAMQKSRLQGPSTFHSVLKGPKFISNTLRPRSEPRKAVPSLNVPTGALFENNLIPGGLKLKTLNMKHFVQRQSGDSFCDQLRYPNFQEKLIHSKRINFNRTLLLKNCFSGSQKGDTPLNHSFVPKNGGTRRTGETQAFYFSKDALVSVKVVVLFSKRANPLVEFPFTLEILGETPFSP